MIFERTKLKEKYDKEYKKLFSDLNEEEKVVVSMLKDEIDETFNNVLSGARELLRRFCASHSSENNIEMLARVIETDQNFASLEQKQDNKNKFFMWVSRKDGRGAFLGIYIILSLSRTPLIRYFSWIVNPELGKTLRKDPFALEETPEAGKYGGAGFMLFYPFFHELTHVSNLHILVNEEVAGYIMRLFDESVKNKTDLLPPAFAPYSILDDKLDSQQEVISTIVQNRIFKYRLNILYTINPYVRYIMESEANIGGLLATMLVFFYYMYVIRKIIMTDISTQERYKEFYEKLATLVSKTQDTPQDRYQIYLHFLSFINNFIINQNDFISFVENYFTMYLNTYKSTFEHLLGRHYIGTGSVDRFTFGIYNIMYNFIDALSQGLSKDPVGKGSRILSVINKMVANDLAYYTYMYAKSNQNKFIKEHRVSDPNATSFQKSLNQYMINIFSSFTEAEAANPEYKGQGNLESVYNTAMHKVLEYLINDAVNDVKGLKEYSEHWKQMSIDVFKRWKETANKYSDLYDKLLFSVLNIMKQNPREKIDQYTKWINEVEKDIQEIISIASETKVKTTFKFRDEIIKIKEMVEKAEKRSREHGYIDKILPEIEKNIEELRNKVAREYFDFINNLDLDQNIKDAIFMALSGIQDISQLDSKQHEFAIVYNLSNPEDYDRFVEHVLYILAAIVVERSGARAPEMLNKYMSILIRHPLFNKTIGSLKRKEGDILHHTQNILDVVDSYLSSQFELFDRVSEYVKESINSIKKDYIITHDILHNIQSNSESIDMSVKLNMDQILNKRFIEKSSVSLLALHNSNIDKLLKESESSSQKYYSIDHRLISYLFYTNITDFTFVIEDLIYAFDVVFAASRTLFEKVSKLMGKQPDEYFAFAFSLFSQASKYGVSPFGVGEEANDSTKDEQKGDDRKDKDNKKKRDQKEDQDKQDNINPDGEADSEKDTDSDQDTNDEIDGGTWITEPSSKKEPKSPKDDKQKIPRVNKDEWEKEKETIEQEYQKETTIERDPITIEIDQLEGEKDRNRIIYDRNVEESPIVRRNRDIYKKYKEQKIIKVVSGLPEGVRIAYRGVFTAVNSASYLLYKILLENYYGFVNNNIKSEEGYLHSGFGASSSEKSYIDPSIVPSQMESSPDQNIIPVSAVIKKDFEPEYTLVTADYISIDVSGSMHGFIQLSISAGQEPHLKNTALETLIKELFIQMSKNNLLNENVISELLVNNDNESAKLISSYLRSFASSFDADKLMKLVDLAYSTFAFAFYVDPQSVLSSRFFRNANFASIMNNAEPKTTMVSVTALSSRDEDEIYYPSLTLMVDKQIPNTVEKIRYAANYLTGGNDTAYAVGYAWGETVLKDIILSTLLNYHHHQDNLPNKKIDVALNIIHITDLYYDQDSFLKGFVKAIVGLKKSDILYRIMQYIEDVELMGSKGDFSHSVITLGADGDKKIINMAEHFTDYFTIDYEIDDTVFAISIYTKSSEPTYIKFGIHFNNLGFFSYGAKQEAIRMFKADAQPDVLRHAASSIINALDDKEKKSQVLSPIAVYNAYRMLPKSISVMFVDQQSILMATLAILLIAYLTIKQKEKEVKDFAFTEEEMKEITINIEKNKNIIAKIIQHNIIKKDLGVRMSTSENYNLSSDNPALYHATFEDFVAWTGIIEMDNPIQNAPGNVIDYVTSNKSDILDEQTREAIKEQLAKQDVITDVLSSSLNVIASPPLAPEKNKTRNKRI